jgi:hypothetical protein
MLKQSFSKAKEVLAILLAVFFVASLTVGAASACHFAWTSSLWWQRLSYL